MHSKVSAGDVIAQDEHLPRGLWKLGKIKTVMRGGDGHIRGATVKTTTTDGQSILLNDQYNSIRWKYRTNNRSQMKAWMRRLLLTYQMAYQRYLLLQTRNLTQTRENLQGILSTDSRCEKESVCSDLWTTELVRNVFGLVDDWTSAQCHSCMCMFISLTRVHHVWSTGVCVTDYAHYYFASLSHYVTDFVTDFWHGHVLLNFDQNKLSRSAIVVMEWSSSDDTLNC